MKTAVFIALVGLVLAASYSSSLNEDEVREMEKELEEIRNDLPSERLKSTIEDDLDDADYEEGEGMEEKYNEVQNDWGGAVENEMDSAFNNLGEQVSDPFRRSRRSRSRRSFRRFGRRRRRRRRRRRECIRLPGRCR